MKCDFCEKCCSCHHNPPCHFCTVHIECEVCGAVVCEDKAEEMTSTSDGTEVIMCPHCASEYY